MASDPNRVQTIAGPLEHRAEKWVPVFRANDATTKAWSKLRY